MTRVSVSRLIGFVCLVMMCAASRAGAQVLFEQLDPLVVPRAPEYFAAGRFNADAFDDLAVLSPRDRELTILLGGPKGFQSGSVVRFGRDLHGLALGDLNGDGFLDVAVADRGASGFWVVFGRGDGTVDPPTDADFSTVGSQGSGEPSRSDPVALAIADFDGINGLDVAVSDRDTGRVFLELNDGTGKFAELVPGPTATIPGAGDLVAADFNQDAIPDLAVMGEQGETREVVLLFGPTFSDLRSIIAGDGAVTIAIADLNSDTAAPDIGTANPGNRQFGADISLFLSQGLGEFSVGATLGVCPEGTPEWGATLDTSTLVPEATPSPLPQGTPVCFAVGLAAADLNGDGTTDLAVAVRVGDSNGPRDILRLLLAPALRPPLMRPPVAVAFQNGPSFFLPSTDVSANALAIGDFVGDEGTGLPDARLDLAVGTSTDSSVSLFHNLSGPVAPTPTPTGAINACVGDCDDDGKVGISELIAGVGIALGRTAVEQCLSFDIDSDGRVSISELVAAVAKALGGCS